MVRPREFDESCVLSKLLQVFWSKGYDGASIEDLVQASGLGRASLYGAFGDKAQLYRRVLDHYLSNAAAQQTAALATATGPQKLSHLFRACIGATCPRTGPKGCFLQLAGTSTEGAPFAREILDASMARTEQLFASALNEGIANGEIGAHVDADDAATLMTVLLQGIAVSARAGWPKARLQKVAEQAIALVLA
jgi:TetR/AcrR family transcriptional regulator, copper-responsive repressor